MSRRTALATLVLFAALALLFVGQDPTEARHRPWRGPHVTEDGWYYFHWLRSAALDGDLDLTDDYRTFGNWYGFGVTATGRPHNPFGIGPALFWAPGFALGHAVAKLGNQAAPDRVANGYSRAEQAGALSTSFLAAAGAFWLCFALCRRIATERAAWLGTALAFLGGPLLWYALYSPAMPHALEACCASAFFFTYLPSRGRTPREAALLGLVAGAMLLVRPQLAVLLVLPLLEAATAPRQRWAALATTLAVAALVFSPQLYVWKLSYGSWLVVPQGSGFMRWAEPLWSETLFSSRNGLFTTTPLLWFVIPGLYYLARRDLGLGLASIAAFALEAWVNGAVWDWWGGGAFGGRRYAATFPIWALALTALGTRLAEPGTLRALRLGLSAALVGGLGVLQWKMLVAHHARRLPWETALPFRERVALATGRAWPGPNPFAFPANALFALEHGVPLDAYDRAVGPYLLDERLPTTNPLLPRKRRETVLLSADWARAFFGRGFLHTPRGAELRGPVGELFLPLNRPGRLRVELELDGSQPARWSFNGAAGLDVAASAVKRGVNVLRVEAAPGLVVRSVTLIEGEDWPPAWATVYEAER